VIRMFFNNSPTRYKINDKMEKRYKNIIVFSKPTKGQRKYIKHFLMIETFWLSDRINRKYTYPLMKCQAPLSVHLSDAHPSSQLSKLTCIFCYDSGACQLAPTKRQRFCERCLSTVLWTPSLQSPIKWTCIKFLFIITHQYLVLSINLGISYYHSYL
jgi:hypothetical protein